MSQLAETWKGKTVTFLSWLIVFLAQGFAVMWLVKRIWLLFP